MVTSSDMIVRVIKYKKFTVAQVSDMLDDCGSIYRSINTNRWTKKYLKKIGDIIGEDLTIYATR